jgi:hypothetical protein
MAGLDLALIDGLALCVKLQAAEELGALGKFNELVVAAELSGGKLIEIDRNQIGFGHRTNSFNKNGTKQTTVRGSKQK